MCGHHTGEKAKSWQARILIKVVRVYQLTFSAVLGRSCRYLPTCSSYTTDAIVRFGAWRGFWLGFSRIMRCNPWGGDGYDPIPESLPDHGWRFWRYGKWRAK